MKPIKLGIFHQLVIFVSILVFVTSGVFGVWFSLRTRQISLSELVLRAEVLTKNLAENSVKGVETQNVFQSLNPLVESVMKQKDISYVHILDAAGSVLASSVLKTNEPIGEGAARLARPDLGEGIWTDTDFSGQKVIEIESPVFLSRGSLTLPLGGVDSDLLSSPIPPPTRIGAVRLGVSLKSLNKEIEKGTLFAVLMFGAVSMVGTGAALIFARWFATRIENLAAAAKEVGEGRYEVYLAPRGQDELEDLARAFNKMTKELRSARELLEQKVRERTAELLESHADMEHFSAAAAHDLKEPLRMVAHYIQLFGDRYKGRLDPDADQMIDHVTEAVRRMYHLLDAVQVYTRVGIGNREIHPLNTTRSFELAMESLQVAIQESKATVTRGALPTVTANETEMMQLFQNLIGNAIKYRQSPPPRIHLSAQYDSQSSLWLFSVRDNGIGINPAYFGKIFLPFERLHLAKEYAGTGMGLAICKRIVEKLGGRIWVESEPGKGSTFFFTLPGASLSPPNNDKN